MAWFGQIKFLLVTHCAVEALAVVVVVEGLHPSVAGLDREAAGDALGREQLVPICKREQTEDTNEQCDF